MRFYHFAILTVFVTLSFLCGCSQKDEPELTSAEYGRTVSTLPEVPNKPSEFKLPETVESSDCQIADQVRRERIAEKEKEM